jgi:DHA3 family macrolide efflux protein-like MFS transporter
MALCGFVVPMFNTSAVTILQTNIEPQIMGRVMGVYMMLNSLSMPIGMVVFGPLGDAVRIELLLIVTGTIILLSGFVLLGMKDLMRIGKPAVEPAKEES